MNDRIRLAMGIVNFNFPKDLTENSEEEFGVRARKLKAENQPADLFIGRRCWAFRFSRSSGLQVSTGEKCFEEELGEPLEVCGSSMR